MNEEISMNESIQAGAPDINYKQGDVMMGGGEDKHGKQMADSIWEQIEPEKNQQFGSFDAFFQSGIWKQIIQQMQQDNSGIKSQAPNMSMNENVNVAESMPGGGIADVDMREQVQMAANGGLMGLYNRGM
jgi:hypothetical protein